MDISVVMAYHNRRPLLINTLKSIKYTDFSGDFEIIVVDDGSKLAHRVDDLPKLFPELNIKVVTVNPNKKWWVNPCIPFNIGFSAALGQNVIIQNPECLHMGDIISHTASTLKANDYIAYAAYAIGPAKTNEILSLPENVNIVEGVNRIVQPLIMQKTGLVHGAEKWYQHGIYSPRAINFCCSIKKEDLNDLGGFDERFACGIAKDDIEFVVRIKRKGMNIVYEDNLFVVHQCHGYTSYSNKALVDINSEQLKKTLVDNSYKVENKLNSANIKELLI